MSYQQFRTTGELHKINEFIPNYQVHSDFLPNRVVDTNLSNAQEWVLIFTNLDQQLRRTKTQRSSLHSKTR